MLLSDEVSALAQAFAREAKLRRELTALVPPQLLHDDHFWQMLFDLMENVIHRNGVVLVRQSDYRAIERRGAIREDAKD